jgi:16S rRNA (guanine(966)-N(2))-methyltransferase RsmD
MRGRRIVAPRGDATRPTSDKVRQSIFNILGQRFDGGSVLDLYAGSGALGLEALSRGASGAVFVDAARAACEAVKSNSDALGYAARARVEQVDAMKYLARVASSPGPAGGFALVFADPPYAAGVSEALLDAFAKAHASGALAPGARIVLEHGKRESPPPSRGALDLQQSRRFGDTVVSFYLVR